MSAYGTKRTISTGSLTSAFDPETDIPVIALIDNDADTAGMLTIDERGGWRVISQSCRTYCAETRLQKVVYLNGLIGGEAIYSRTLLNLSSPIRAP
jgi:hypothetical protein